MAHVNPPLVAETGTLSAGVITVSGAVTSPGTYRTFAAALTDGDTVDVVVRDAQGDQASYPASTWNETAGTLTLGSQDVSSGVITDGAVVVWAAAGAELSQAQVEDDASAVFGLVSGQRLAQAVAAHGADLPAPSSTVADLTGLVLDQSVRTYTNAADELSVSGSSAGEWMLIHITGGANTITSSGVTWADGQSVADINHSSGVVELLLRNVGGTVYASTLVLTT